MVIASDRYKKIPECGKISPEFGIWIYSKRNDPIDRHTDAAACPKVQNQSFLVR